MAAEVKAFLLEALGRQRLTAAGLNSAQVLVHCLKAVASPESLLSAALALLQNVLHASHLEVGHPLPALLVVRSESNAETSDSSLDQANWMVFVLTMET